MSVDVSGEVTAIATSVLAFFAIVTAVFAVLAFLKQSREVRAIERQVTDQQELTQQQGELLRVQSGQLELQRQQFADQLAERRRAQVSCVFIWIELEVDVITAGRPPREDVIAQVRNTSAQPIYDLTVGWHRGTAPWGEPDHFPVLTPGDLARRRRTLPEDLPTTVDRALYGAVARFRDAAAVHWRLRSDGQLDEEPATG